MITFSSRCGSESRREPKTRRGRAVPEPFEFNATIPHPAPAAITIRHDFGEIFADSGVFPILLWVAAGGRRQASQFKRLVPRGLGYTRIPPFFGQIGSRNRGDALRPAESVARESAAARGSA